MTEVMRIVHPDRLSPFAEVIDGRSSGITVDIVRGAAERAGLRIEFLAVPFEQVEAGLHDGRADMAIPIAVTTERRERFDFSDTLLMTGGSLFVRAGEASPEGLAVLAGKVVVTPRTGPLAAYIAKTAPDVKLMVTSDYEESLRLLVGGEAYAAALNHQAGAMIAAKLHPGMLTLPRKLFLELPFGAAVLTGTRSEMIAALNAGLAAVKGHGNS